jgi:hypothetical protein
VFTAEQVSAAEETGARARAERALGTLTQGYDGPEHRAAVKWGLEHDVFTAEQVSAAEEAGNRAKAERAL